MAVALARSAASSCATPHLDLWYLGPAGVLADPYELEFQIHTVADDGTLEQTYPPSSGDRAPVDVEVTCPDAGAGRIRTGRFVAPWVVPIDEPLGRHRITWYAVDELGGEERAYEEDFDVLAEGLRLRQPAYCLLSDVRAEGMTAAQLSDARALDLITLASRRIEKWTSRRFEPTFEVSARDGRGSSTIYFDSPIIALESVISGGTNITFDQGLTIYNRRVIDGLALPDDRENPRITFGDSLGDGGFLTGRAFPRGSQNITVAGLFGYTDRDERQPAGITPDEIRRATVMLVRRLMLPAGSAAAIEQQNQGNIRAVRTRDQSIEYHGSSSGSASGASWGSYTGDAELDRIIRSYSAPPYIGGT